MTGEHSPRRMPGHSWTVAPTSALLAVIAVSAIVRIVFASQDNLGYDSAWHVFIARQSSWDDFWLEIKNNAHPPLFYLTLVAAVELFGRSLLAYRAVSIAATLASVWLLAHLTARLTSNVWIGVVAAAAFGLSFTALDVSLEVRAYALAGALMLAAFVPYLDWIRAPAEIGWGKRILFTGAATAAVLTHYSTFFFLAAAVSTPILLGCVDRSWRKRLDHELKSHPVALALMLLTPLAVAAVAYQMHAGIWSRSLDHVVAYLYVSERESMVAFLSRTTREFLALVLPTFGFARAPLTLIALLAAGLCLVALRRLRSSVAVVPFAFVIVMIALNILAALAGRHPFGGYLRHEFFLFPWLVICLFTATEFARLRLKGAWSSPRLWSVAAAVLVAVNSLAAAFSFHATSIDPVLFGHHVEKFRETVGEAPTILVDQFSLIIFLTNNNDSRWQRTFQDVERGVWQVWDLHGHGSDVRLCRSRQWQLDFSSADTYHELIDCLKQTGAISVAVFRPQQPEFEPAWIRHDAQSLTNALARKEGLYPTRLMVDDEGVFGVFALARPPAVE
jgi:uncharacterized membrane protein